MQIWHVKEVFEQFALLLKTRCKTSKVQKRDKERKRKIEILMWTN